MSEPDSPRADPEEEGEGGGEAEEGGVRAESREEKEEGQRRKRRRGARSACACDLDAGNRRGMGGQNLDIARPALSCFALMSFPAPRCPHLPYTFLRKVGRACLLCLALICPSPLPSPALQTVFAMRCPHLSLPFVLPSLPSSCLHPPASALPVPPHPTTRVCPALPSQMLMRRRWKRLRGLKWN